MTEPAFLDVIHSLTGRAWAGPSGAEDRQAARLSQEAGLSPHVALLLARAGVAPEEAEAYLAPTLRSLMPDPSSLLDLDAATARFLEALRRRERIAIFADYDVDGGASAALLIDWLRQKGHGAELYIPDRIAEGYGPNIPAMEALAAHHDLIICVDCGTLAFEPIAAARAKGADVLVLDHHQGGETLPDATAVVNPNRQDETSPLTYLCAAGVVYLLLVAANRGLRAAGEPAPDLLPMLDLAALATVADVAPLRGLNRAIVRQGLAIMARRTRPGLRALADAAGISSAPTAYHLGFLLGPRVNAGGRIGAADLGAKLLATQDDTEAEALAARLDALNGERRAVEAHVLEAAEAAAEANGAEGALAWAAGEGWHPGVVGIVASRLKEKFQRPAIVIGLEGGKGKGSGRSVQGIDLGTAIATATREGLLLKGGGHAMAAGLELAENALPAAMARIEALLARQSDSLNAPKTLSISGLVTAGAATPDLVEDIAAAGPFGAGAPEPRFALAAQRIRFAKRVGDAHLRLTFADATGTLDAILFRAFEGPLGPALEAHDGRAFHIAGKLEINDWGGRRKAQLRLDDAALTE